MTPERWQQITGIFEAALKRDPASRAAFVAAACPGDDELRQEVEGMLSSHERAGGFIESPAMEVAARQSDGESLIGQTIAHYQVLSLLGSGGMGDVYLALDTKLGRKVALKLLPEYLAGDTQRARLFTKEARTASALNHPNIITIHEIGQLGERHYIAMEYIEGETLGGKIHRERAPLEKLLKYLQQVAEGLTKAHATGIAHRDLKPDNIMITRDGFAKVLDFGLAKLIEQPQRLGGHDFSEAATPLMAQTSVPGMVMGTVGYMSPEQAQGKTGEIDQRSDIFSFGCILYEAATGKKAFEGADLLDSLHKIVHAATPQISEVIPNLPADLDRIVRRCLMKDPASRYQSIKDVAIELEDLQHELKAKIPGRVASKAIDSIAVLPLANAGADSDVDYLSDGITESLINSFSQLSELRVVARTTAFRYKGKEVDPRAVGRELGVQAVLTGNLRLRGEHLTVQVELVETGEGAQLWGEQYDRQFSDVLVLKQEITRQISDKLRLRLTGTEQKQLARQETANTDAYQSYLKGRHFWNRRTAENLKKAIEQFQQAIEKDQNYALAYVGLADCYLVLEDYAGTPASETIPKARGAVLRALQIDDSLAEAHTSLALINETLWQWGEAEKEFNRALSLNPNYPTAHQWYSMYLKTVGQHEEAVVQIKRAQELDPLSPVISVNRAEMLILKGNIEAAIEQSQRIIELYPNYPGGYEQLATAYLKQQRYAEAIVELHKALDLSGRSSGPLSELGHCYALAGKRAEAFAILKELEERYDRRESPAFWPAALYAGLGDRDQAFAWLEKAFQARSGALGFLTWYPYFDPLRRDPRYGDLVRRLGLKP